jgi:acetyltransferase-like isoleucine patch superfamily enzyme
MISIHPTAVVATSRIGDGTRIWAFCNVLAGAAIGSGCNICDRCFVENDVVIGDRVTVKCGVSLWDGVRLEDDVFIGPDVSFSNDPRPRSGVHLDSHPRTVVRTGASIGTGSILLPGVTVGRYAMVGAGSLVTRDLPDFALAYGSPARLHGFVCRCGKTLKYADSRAACACGREYDVAPDGSAREA